MTGAALLALPPIPAASARLPDVRGRGSRTRSNKDSKTFTHCFFVAERTRAGCRFQGGALHNRGR
eukprot:7702663-Prorocentrum_lima.AAC.1